MNIRQNYPISGQSGFTIIEILIVVSIISILAATGAASYQVKVRQTHLMTLYQELNHFRMPYQLLINEGVGVTDFSPSGLNIPEQTKYCQFTVNAPAKSGVTKDAVKCTIQNLPYAQSETISLDRAVDGSWECRPSLGIAKSYLPQACQ